MKRYFEIQAKARSDEGDIFLYEPIGGGLFDEGIGAKQFAADLKALGNVKRLNVHINSPGGSVFEGLAIYNQLRAHKADKYIYIDGLAASIASVIAMSGTWVTMADNAIMMVHDPTGATLGNAEDHRKTADTLDKVKQSIISAYVDKSRMKAEDIADMMAAETWLSATEAKSLGFADEITGAMKIAAHFDLSQFHNIPEKIKNGGFTMSYTDNIDSHKKDLIAERERVSNLIDIGKQYNCQDIALRLVQNGGSVEDLRAAIMTNMKAAQNANQPLGPFVTVEPAHGGLPFRNLGDQLRAVMVAGTPGGRADHRLYQVGNFRNAASGLHEAVGAEGGFLLQGDFSTQLLEKVNEVSQLASRCAKIPLASNSIKLPVIDETSRATGSRWGGVQAYWTAEGTEPTSKKPKLAALEMSLSKLMALCYATEELLEDQAALEAVIARGFTEEIAFLLDDAIINGLGTGQPLGILKSSALVTVAKETGQTTGSLVWENLVKMWSRIPSANKKNAAWVIHASVWPQLLNMSFACGTAGVPAFVEPGRASTAPLGQIFGAPVIEHEAAAALGTVGDIIVCDLSQYLLVDKSPRSDVSIHVKFTTDERCFKFVYRCNGMPIWKSSVAPFKGSDAVSPFVALAAR